MRVALLVRGRPIGMDAGEHQRAPLLRRPVEREQPGQRESSHGRGVLGRRARRSVWWRPLAVGATRSQL